MDFGIRVGNIDAATARLRDWGIAVHGEPQSLDVGSGEWRYVYFAEPDGNYVTLVEARY
jgi:predicted enzyme related to lactoylglutathione lyase